MGKRFTDTTIWEMSWYRKLIPIEKCAFNYIKDRCDAVGVWKPDFELAEYMIGGKVDWNHLRESANNNIIVLENGKWFMPDFCSFQYGELNPACKPHRAYIALIEKHDLQSLFSPNGVKGGKGIHTLSEVSDRVSEKPHTLQEKEKEKEKEKTAYAREEGDSPQEKTSEPSSTKMHTLDSVIDRMRESEPSLAVGLAQRDQLEALRVAVGDDTLVAVWAWSRKAKPKPLRFFLEEWSATRAAWAKACLAGGKGNGVYQPVTPVPRTPADDREVELIAARFRQEHGQPLSERDREILGLVGPPPPGEFPEGVP